MLKLSTLNHLVIKLQAENNPFIPAPQGNKERQDNKKAQSNKTDWTF